MIIGERKPLEEILSFIEKHKKILIAGCGTCVAICMAGGDKEVALLASALKLARNKEKKPIEVLEQTVLRQCEWEFADELKDKVKACEAVISMACGIGVQTVAERFPEKIVYPGINTTFLGLPEKQGVWSERCLACGNCVLGKTGGICPIARCSKNLLNGPCGGSQNGKCEISQDVSCAWQLIYDRLKSLGELNRLEEIFLPKDWSTNRDGGPRKIVREDVQL